MTGARMNVLGMTVQGTTGASRNIMVKRFAVVVLAVLVAGLLGACSGPLEIPPYLRPLSKDTMMLLGRKGMTLESPMFIRVFKEESELEVWKQREDGHFYHFKTYPICNWSGGLGPKVQQGDMQAPEGFYTIAQNQMNPNSQFHLAFNLGYPNAFDRANNRNGDFLMIHGKCKSAGCYAMTDALIEEIYAMARESFIGGQPSLQVHALPFRMTQANLERHKASPHIKFWMTLKDGYDHFEATRQPPTVAVCERRYVVNVKLNGNQRVQSDGACPAFERPATEPFTPLPLVDAKTAETVVVPGAKQRSLASIEAAPAPRLGGNPSYSPSPSRPSFGLSGNGGLSGNNLLGLSQ